MRSCLGIAAALLIVAFGWPFSAEAAVVADRTAVRFTAPETGGSARPRFLTEREVAFFSRIEALIEQVNLEPGDYPERYVHVAVDRLVARTMLSSLMVQRGVEPPDLPRLTLEARSDLEARVGGARVLEATMKREGIDEEELISFLRDQVRATYFVDRAIAPILAVTEDTLREAHRAAVHPFRGGKFDDVRTKLRRWLVVERLRAAELEFLQSARSRITITSTDIPSHGRNNAPHRTVP
jgi:hypothetical protein